MSLYRVSIHYRFGGTLASADQRDYMVSAASIAEATSKGLRAFDAYWDTAEHPTIRHIEASMTDYHYVE